MILYAIGYEGRSLQHFLADLGAHGVRLLADVREAPISRKPGFSKSALQQALASAGIAYVHLRALGCPKAIRDAYKESGNWERYTERFMQHLRDQTEAIEQLRALSQARPTALLCYEADFNRCHRTYVAQAVAAPLGARVCHIAPNRQQELTLNIFPES
jgi:uncharacterized protein (DUF488 family)